MHFSSRKRVPSGLKKIKINNKKSHEGKKKISLSHSKAALFKVGQLDNYSSKIKPSSSKDVMCPDVRSQKDCTGDECLHTLKAD